tara:strand:+ start:519 stop:656 length:138 start_codon:yes stop_codon:yes gene_type:complete
VRLEGNALDLFVSANEEQDGAFIEGKKPSKTCPTLSQMDDDDTTD